jgi:hypothetical protein
MDECAGNKIAITDIACGTASVNSPSELYSLLATSKDNQCETSCFIMSAYYSIETGLRHGHANVMTAYPLDNGQIKIFDHAFPDDQNEVRCTILQHSAINSRLHMNVLRALACLLTSASQLEMDANMLAPLIPAS